jgi:hypothetical protein
VDQRDVHIFAVGRLCRSITRDGLAELAKGSMTAPVDGERTVQQFLPRRYPCWA